MVPQKDYASNFAPVVVPEPATLVMVSIGLTGIVAAPDED